MQAEEERTDGPVARPRLPRSTSLTVIVAAYNEQYLVEESLGRLAVLGECSFLERITVVVVDDCSSDRTPDAIARFRGGVQFWPDGDKFKWVWLRHDRNQGKGASIRTALPHADTELVVIHDADLEYHPRDLLRMAELFLFEDADAVFGSRFLAGGYKRALFFRHALGNKLLTFLCDLVCDLNLTDMETCYKMVRTGLLKSIPLECSRFDLEPEMVIKLARRDCRIFEVPISYSGRTYREGKKITWKDGIHALWAIWRYAISDRLYAETDAGKKMLERLNRAPRFNRWMAEVISPHVGERVLEIGAGIGNLSVHLMPRTAYWATDVDSLYLNTLSNLRESRPYMRTAYTDATAAETFPNGESFDTVVCLNVLEHLPDDVAVLRNFREILEENGRAIILVPNSPKLYGSFDKLLGHYRRYTPDQLARVAQEAGFQVEKFLKFNRPGVVAWWLNACLLRKQGFGRMQARLLNMLVPIFRVLDRWIPLPPLSLIAVLRKPCSGTVSGAPPAGEPQKRSREMGSLA